MATVITPELKVRKLYCKTYIKYSKTVLNRRIAQAEAYSAVLNTYGREAHDLLRQWHLHNLEL